MFNHQGNMEDMMCNQCNAESKDAATPDFIRVTQLARAYVPVQHMTKIYDADTAIRRGTIFPELDMPYEKCEKQ